ncbi:tRNA preQ1(34) S-adenosylmethionine ribosyltransferase-isomerase QueA [Novispirillum itersonii]|uniref:S-adenosylmethionine:tRNA ribosyltransferase-isomerase n=1 Tax=Novispirillum itersonii TaxID=189 RepID=A0A7W9ZIG2_NOVIT|nr:tRNA preQ1(34) S-adenosylmethionine ribosyltransferase-isomerase QueA [Novispirillum itersonii]MBB6212093.1 S-adenosylmethionine:tRNA ribosyltransferase-isomerase [Novispirillum itersonii]
MRVDAFDFDLPKELIADRPVTPRDAARLLDVTADGCHDRGVRDLPGLLQPGDVMVFNDTRVIPARLFGQRGPRQPGGLPAQVEVTLHQALGLDTWAAFAKGAKRLSVGDVVTFAADFAASVLEKHDGGEVILRFNRAGPELMQALETHGHLPLPPYMGRDDDARDRQDYQTVYARHDGAVAAPTAGLHFTPALLEALDARGVKRVHVTLHVGAGTFLPVKVDDTRDHRMHSENGLISAETAATLNAARAAGGRVVCVGTTSMRLIESAAQEDGTIPAWSGSTDIFITPGYRFKAVDLLMTNFHLPRSTLFMLVSAFAGMDRMRAAYQQAIATGYRFYSYGDSSLLRREETL